MKKLILGLMAAASLGIAVPAVAHEYENQRPTSDWGYNSGYGEFSDDIAHLREGLQHGLSDGSYSRHEARRFYREIRSIERQATYFYASGGYSPWERQAIQRRIDNLHAIMHDAHDEGHEQQDGGYPYYNR